MDDKIKLKLDELERISVNDFKSAEKFPLILILDNVRSLHNVGALFRTSDAFRVQSLYLCGITGCPPHKELNKTALGATESVDWKYFATTKEAVLYAKELNYQVYALEQTTNSIMLQNFKPNFPLAIVLGNEVNGVDDEVIPLCDGVVEIPQFGTKHSFNVSVSAAIVIWQLYLLRLK
ncbi:MAG: RNA methyltransferase [Bacteroidetes bacterium]|nr:RNA methyltransferase [Bacteroidota bacterium]